MTTTITEFDAAEYLDSPEMIATYLKVAFEENDAALIRIALNDVARAKGMTEVAAESKITRQALYKALGPNGNMTLETLLGVLRAMGVRLSVSG
ncbi:MAG: putative addiction module antidote protein [Sphingomonadales bacterium]|nr:putative addiction module antidote protein [Sphingomonadales bacterium]NCO48279.1 putative addiction module antidote protein [Sphingomonadales bacterium]NCP00609.1 putative addiction module antidote protein [Sphingomonadales bacterium]NCP25387.1 putative addiction module antidote protein [Sphingomonadales bacterium]NCP41823.1 putative addiction module antidote protein [Sphingomonadales bacterium]